MCRLFFSFHNKDTKQKIVDFIHRSRNIHKYNYLIIITKIQIHICIAIFSIQPNLLSFFSK